jgi:calcium binding protein 39
MVDCLGTLDFEAQKDVVQIWGALLRIEEPNGVSPGLDYLESHPDLVSTLFEGFDKHDIALNCGQMFRECIRHEAIAADVLASHMFQELFEKLEIANFEVASGKAEQQGV